MQRLREVMEEVELKAEKAKMEAEMAVMAVDINEAMKGEYP